MPSATIENYCKAIFKLRGLDGSEWVTTGQLSVELGVTPGSITSMANTLADSQLVEYRRYQGVRLSPAGERLALRMLRRHRLIEQFLVQTLDLSWDEVHDEAEAMEHAVSDALVDRIDAFLGHPACDPHGDPIPRSDGTLRGASRELIPLSEVPAGTGIRVSRVLKQGTEFLQYLAGSDISIGMTAEVVENLAESEVMHLKCGDRAFPLAHATAKHLLVERTEQVALEGHE